MPIHLTLGECVQLCRWAYLILAPFRRSATLLHVSKLLSYMILDYILTIFIIHLPLQLRLTLRLCDLLRNAAFRG